MSDFVERLREPIFEMTRDGFVPVKEMWRADMNEAASELTRLRKEVAEWREAARPFAKAVERLDYYGPPADTSAAYVKVLAVRSLNYSTLTMPSP